MFSLRLVGLWGCQGWVGLLFRRGALDVAEVEGIGRRCGGGDDAQGDDGGEDLAHLGVSHLDWFVSFCGWFVRFDDRVFVRR